MSEEEHAPAPLTQHAAHQEEEVDAPPPAPALVAAATDAEHAEDTSAGSEKVPAKRRQSKGKRIVHFIRRISHTEKHHTEK